jgi:hypothetical protein
MISTLQRTAEAELRRFWSRCNEKENCFTDAEAALMSIALLPIISFALTGDGKDFFNELAHRAYHHHNGFVKITLPGSGLGGKNLRIHIWDTGEDSIVNSDAHDHRWNFSSRVLAGRIGHITYLPHVSQSGDLYHYMHKSSQREGVYKLDLIGRGALEKQTENGIPNGATYSLDSEIVHRVGVSLGQYAATLVLEQAEMRCTTNVYSLIGNRTSDLPYLSTSRCSRYLVHQSLQKLTEHLSS